MCAHPSSALKRLPRLVAVSLLAAALAGCNMVVLNPTGDIAIQQRNLILIATGLNGSARNVSAVSSGRFQ